MNMNAKLKWLFARRSVRQYKPGEVPDSAVTDILEAAMAAPSAGGKDPWHFVVFRDRARLSRVAEGLPNGRMLESAAVGIAVCGELQRTHDRQESFLIQDCSAAVENILLAATALGLGGCWLGVHPRTDRSAHIRKVLSIPEDVIPIAVVSIGWPSEPPQPRTRFNPSAVHYEAW